MQITQHQTHNITDHSAGGAHKVSVTSDVRYERVKGYSRKQTIGYTANTRDKHRNKQCDYVMVFRFVFLFILTSFLTTKPSLVQLKKKLNSVAFSPQANYTDRATAACRPS
jgi:hypothetical protein